MAIVSNRFSSSLLGLIFLELEDSVMDGMQDDDVVVGILECGCATEIVCSVDGETDSVGSEFAVTTTACAVLLGAADEAGVRTGV